MPVLEVWPAAIVRVTSSLRSKSFVVAPASGVAATVTVVTALDVWFRDAVTVVEPPFSEIVSSESVIDSVTVGVPSSSVIVPVPMIEVALPANEA